MDYTVVLCLLLINIKPHHAQGLAKRNVTKSNDSVEDSDSELDVDKPEDLPPSEPLKPGHTLIRPESGMLQSSSKYPESDKTLVYGNFDNLGIVYGKTKHRTMYSGFRRANDLVDTIKQLLAERKNRRNPLVVYVAVRNKNSNKSDFQREARKEEKVSELENKASEILDDPEFQGPHDHHFRRRYSSSSRSSSGSRSSSESDSSDYERVPGNPYTMFKNKYRGNHLWNFAGDGDHMNINPYAPAFNSLGPSAAALFFNRKWWYYNQDDYRPFD